jgi:hypothetical protein
MAEKEFLVCLNCLEPWPVNAPLVVVCPICGARHDVATRERICRLARDATRFGYEYRYRFESQVLELGKIRKFYVLGPTDPVIITVVLSILKSLATKVAYDVIKASATAVMERCRSKLSAGKIKKAGLNDLSVDTLIGTTRDFANDLDGVDSRVRDAIHEEIRAETVSKATVRTLLSAGAKVRRKKRGEKSKGNATETAMISELFRKGVGAGLEELKDRKSVKLDDIAQLGLGVSEAISHKRKGRARRRSKRTKKTVRL